MISGESMKLITAHLIHGATTVRDPGVRQANRTALAELGVLIADRRAAEGAAERAADDDQTLIEDAVRRHAVEMLRLSAHRPQPGEILPAHDFAQAQWHQLRILALRAAPPDLAAAQLREEALRALNPKLTITKGGPS